jgi:glycosyltransferase involved in cell wall biosynthesis
MNKKILLIAYYWPPGGGIAVRRWMGLANALCRNGVEVHVLTINPASAAYQHVDESLAGEIEDGIIVHRVKAFNPFAVIKKVAPSAIPGPSFSENKSSGLLGRLLTVLRSHLFIPDPRKTWVRKAVQKGCVLVDEYGLQTIITTSPPQSVQLIGQGIKRARPNVQWMADFRDPWTDIFYYERLGHSVISRRIDAAMERRALQQADQVVAVSWGFRDLLASKVEPEDRGKFHVLTNGMDFDPVDHENESRNQDGPFRIVHTGTIAPSYAPELVLDAITALNAGGEHRPFEFDYYGGISAEYRKELEERYDFIRFHGFVAQHQIGAIQRAADVLFLLGPDVDKSKGHIPGKLFEYMGALRPIAFLGHPSDDVTRILVDTQTGVCLPRGDALAIREVLVHLQGSAFNAENVIADIQPYIRSNQAQRLLDLLG